MLSNFLTTADVMACRRCSRTAAISFIRTHGGFKACGIWIIHRSNVEAVSD